MHASLYDLAVVTLCLFFSIMPAFIAVSIRESVKKQRQLVIGDLSDFFDQKHLDAHTSVINIVYSFEFVKFKYMMPSVLREESGSGRIDTDFKKREWFYSALPLVILLTFINILISCIIASLTNCSVLSFLPDHV